MTDKEKQIEEMAKIISSLCDMPYCDTCYAYKEYNGCTERKNAEELYSAGYRKQSEVAENIIAMLRSAKPVVKTHFEAYDELIENIAAEYGAEVEK